MQLEFETTAGSLTAVSETNPLPVGGMVRATGTIVAVNGNVELLTQGRDTLVIQVAGTYTGALTVQGTADGTNWVSLGGAAALMNLGTSAYSATIASATQGLFQIGVSGLVKVRVIGLSAMTGTATVTLVAVDGNAMLALDAALPAGAAVIGAVTQSGTWTVTQSGAWTTSQATGTAYSLVTAATTNAALMKASAGNLFELTISNVTAATIYVKIYNKASAPTVGTDIPVLTVPVVAGALVSVDLGTLGKRLTAGIAIAVTAAAAATDTTAVTAGAQISATYV